MAAYITSCFSSWQSDTFKRGICAIVRGKRTDRAIRRWLKSREKEGKHWYRKADPDFDDFTYSRCHRTLRRILCSGDVLFFRTLWRGDPYLIGFFRITGKTGPSENPVCHADPEMSALIYFRKCMRITPSLVGVLNPKAGPRCKRPYNQWANEQLGRNWMQLDDATGIMLANAVLLAGSIPD